MPEPLIFELSSPGRQGLTWPAPDVPVRDITEFIPAKALRRSAPELPEVSEQDAVRHFTRLSSLNYGVDTGFYPLGSCTMKYNPKINEDAARQPGFARLHPYQDPATCQGALELMYHLDQYLCEITGMHKFSLQPAAGAHGELLGLLVIQAYHQKRQDFRRNKVIIPDAAHGTNPATAGLVGMDVIKIPSDARGGMDLISLQAALGEDTAALMLTNPNTLGLFDENIQTIAEMVHQAGGLVYYDGANLNAIMGLTRPGDMGFDVIHLNLHKTFATPHGGGGPGAGPVGVKDFLAPFLPKPLVVKDSQTGQYRFEEDMPQTIGRMKAFYGNFGVLVKAYTYIRALGGDGLRKVSEHAVLNANYLLHLLKDHYHLPYQRHCKHEFVITPAPQVRKEGIRTLDIAKRLLDFGYHPPTIYFPLIVEEAIMVEPTETESKETLDQFARAMIAIAEEAMSDPAKLKGAPYTTPVSRLDEVTAARKPVLRWKPTRN